MLPDSYLKGFSRQAITILTLMTHDSHCFSFEEIQEKLSWMPPHRLKRAFEEILKKPILLKVRSQQDGETRYCLD